MGFWWGDPREGDHLEDIDIDRRINIKMDLQYVAWGGTECIDLAQDWDRW